MDWEAIAVSIRLALTTTVLLCFLGLPLAYWLTTCRSKLSLVIESLVSLPLVLPPTVLGFYLLLALSPESKAGKFLETLTGQPLPFSFEGLLIGSVLYSLPFAVQPMLTSFSMLNPTCAEASRCLGASQIKTFFLIILPLSLPGIITGLILSFAHTLGEFGIVLMMGGNIPGKTRTISVSIFDDVQALNYESASQSSLLLLAFSFVILLSISFLKPKAKLRTTK